jgi:hypothetical protein
MPPWSHRDGRATSHFAPRGSGVKFAFLAGINAGPVALFLVPSPIAIIRFCLLAPAALDAAPDLFDGFSGEWRQHWREERFLTKPTDYAVAIDEAGRRVLHAHSEAANAGLVRRFEVIAPTAAVLRWRWKVAAALTGNKAERTRGGDDYAARVFVVFETSVWPLRTRAINYVWAGHEPEGAVFPCPYTRSVGMIVVRSGDGEAGVWREERRDVWADYKKFFGEPPARISAVAVLVDTDNTGLAAEAWFAELSLETVPATKVKDEAEVTTR